MAQEDHIDRILQDWPYENDSLGVRVVRGEDGRRILQMRIDMGLLQLETTGRPDGTQPHGAETYYDYLVQRAAAVGEEFELDDEQCGEVDREFVQYYHRRVCWLRLQKYDKAVRDADHTLGLMDFCAKHSPDDQWTMSHEQYRPFVLFHRTQAAALAELEESSPEQAVQEINSGLDQMREVFDEHELGESFDDDELVQRLTELRETVRDQYEVGRTLEEKLADAVAAEQYELAARIRDELARKGQA